MGVGKETIENNKLIAEFIGKRENSPKNLYTFRTFESKQCFDFIGTYNHLELKFHSDWNWLMQVVEKIFSLDEYYHFKQTLGQFDTAIRDRFPNKEGVYAMCVEFIKWYNSAKKD